MLYRVVVLTTSFSVLTGRQCLAKNVIYVCAEPLATVEMQTISPSAPYRLPFLAPSTMFLAGAHSRRCTIIVCAVPALGLGYCFSWAICTFQALGFTHRHNLYSRNYKPFNVTFTIHFVCNRAIKYPESKKGDKIALEKT